MSEKVYIVTLKKYEDLDGFYSDMASDGYKLHMKRPISRNTQYYMTAEQAEEIKKDSRVLDVELEPSAEVEMSAEPLEVAQVDEGVELVAAGDQFSLFGIFSNGETERRTGEGEEGVLLENVNLDETEKKITLDLNQPLTFRAMDTTDGCVLSIVEKGSEMDLAGISAGSRIMSCGGNKVESVTEIKNILLDCFLKS